MDPQATSVSIVVKKYPLRFLKKNSPILTSLPRLHQLKESVLGFTLNWLPHGLMNSDFIRANIKGHAVELFTDARHQNAQLKNVLAQEKGETP